ncbi:MAG: N-acetylmuramic acid 6-phosphate etherase [Actinomycetota bacterium]
MSDNLDDLANLNTEAVDSRFANIDSLNNLELLKAFNESDKSVPLAVDKVLPAIAQAVTSITARMSQGGRLIYVGAGTSGRLGVLDASECIPTFSIKAGLVVALIAGGDHALRNAVEGAEDKIDGALPELEELGLSASDTVVGIAASGRTPYVIGALKFAGKVGALRVGVTCNPQSEISKYVEHAIEVDTGPEVLAGSTRLKAGSAQKLVLNMISTAVMINLGKTFGNLMVDLQIANEKLRNRAVRIIQAATNCDSTTSEQALLDSGNQVKVAIVMILLGLPRAAAEEALTRGESRIRTVLSQAQNA